jgi:hypothetical protein
VNGSPPKRRTVFTVPEFDWIVDVLEHDLTEVRPRFEVGQHPAFWVTERRGRLSKRSANEAFENARQAAGLPDDLDLHSLRHSMITHRSGAPARRMRHPPVPRASVPARHPATPATVHGHPRRALLLNRHGITVRPARNGALAALASDLPAAILADLLGLHVNTAVRWVTYARRDWTDYLALRAAEHKQTPKN